MREFSELLHITLVKWISWYFLESNDINLTLHRLIALSILFLYYIYIHMHFYVKMKSIILTVFLFNFYPIYPCFVNSGYLFLFQYVLDFLLLFLSIVHNVRSSLVYSSFHVNVYFCSLLQVQSKHPHANDFFRSCNGGNNFSLAGFLSYSSFK